MGGPFDVRMYGWMDGWAMWWMGGPFDGWLDNVIDGLSM